MEIKFGYVLRPIIDIVFAAVGVILLALSFSITKDWFKVTNELDWIAALIFFFGIRIGNRLDLLKEPKAENAKV
jgi:hypothetical protein